MRTCPVCTARYEAPAQYCQVDGTPLTVEVPSEDPYIGHRILDQFRLVRVVGSGGMGVVYEGHDEGLGRRVAVKILHRDLVTNKDIVQRFHREAQIAHKLDHPGIVRVILFGQLSDGNLYLVLEFLEGPTLMQALERDKVFAPSRAVKIIGGVADAVGYTHTRGIVHRDLKPENIVLTVRGDDAEFPKVLDFGIAKMLIGSGSFVTQAGLIFGTARYISPEGASGEAVDQRGDVYSLGVIAYQLLTGHTPFESDEPMQLLLKHMHDVPPPMRHWRPELSVSQALEDVVMRSLAKNPDARFDNADEFAAALRDAASEDGIEVRSLVPTSAMSSIVPGQVQSRARASRAEAVQKADTVKEIPSVAEAERQSPAVPISAVESSGVSLVRTITRPTERAPDRADRRAQSPISTALVGGTAVVAAVDVVPAPNLPPRMEIPVVAPTVVRTPPRQAHAPSLASQRATEPLVDHTAEGDEYRVVPQPVLSWRTIGIVLVSVCVTLFLAAATAYGLRMFPEQRRQDEIAGLLRQANDALLLGRYAHSPNGQDVEDLTDAVLALDARNARALRIRRVAAMHLKTASDLERQANRPERAVTLLQEALRLTDDPTLRDELAAAQREVGAQRTPTVAPTRPTQQPRVAAPPRPVQQPRVDPTLDHPPQPVIPLHPAVTPVPQTPRPGASTQGPRVPQRPQRPHGEAGDVVQSPPNDDMRIMIPGTNVPLLVFGPPQSQAQTQPPPRDAPEDPAPPHTGAF